MTRDTPRTLIDALRPDYKRAYGSLPFIAASLDIFDHLLADTALGTNEDAKLQKQGWNIHIQRAAVQRGKPSKASYVAVAFTRTIEARARGGSYALSTGFSYLAEDIEEASTRGRVWTPAYSDNLTFGLEAKAVMHFTGRRIDWENGPTNVELKTDVKRGPLDQEGDSLFPYSSYRTNYLAGNVPTNGIFVGDQHRRGADLDPSKFQGLYDLASADSRSREEIGRFVNQLFGAW